MSKRKKKKFKQIAVNGDFWKETVPMFDKFSKMKAKNNFRKLYSHGS